ncbi:MAG: SCP2 sterol-binding domain-containing protein [Deltaproteobacteria bacterium]|nr:SCP2 sterol-binding domain-containing protein [Deltaproteobacteria bacterium]
MPIDFPSEEWTKAYKEAINNDPEYKTAGATWEAGPLAFVVSAEPAIGMEQDVAFVLDVHKGECRDAYITEMDEAQKQPFVITGSYAQWKAVIKKELDPIKGMMQGKLKLKGNLPIIVRHVKAAQVLVSNAARIDTRFMDE